MPHLRKPNNLKWPVDQIDILESAYRQFFDSLDYSWDEIKEAAKAGPETSLLFDCYAQVTYDLQYNDTHPAYSSSSDEHGNYRKAKRRRVQHNPNFILYPPGCTDIHMTGLMRELARRIFP